MVGQICPVPPHYCRAPRDRHLYKDKYPKFGVLSKVKNNCCKIHLVDNVRTADEQTEAEEKRSRSQNAANQFPVKYLFSLMITEIFEIRNICFHLWSQNCECDLSIFLRYRAFKVLLSCRLLTVFKICMIQNTFDGDEFLSSILRPSYQQNICKEFGFLTCL